MGEIAWYRNVKGQALEIVVPPVEPAWFASDALRRAAVARHGTAGQDSPECGVWRGMPLSSKQLPPVRSSKRWDDYDVVASPEWLEDGAQPNPEVSCRRAAPHAVPSSVPRA